MRPLVMGTDAGTAASLTRTLFWRKPKIAKPDGFTPPLVCCTRPYPIDGLAPPPCDVAENPPRIGTAYETALPSPIFTMNASAKPSRFGLSADAVGRSAE